MGNYAFHHNQEHDHWTQRNLFIVRFLFCLMSSDAKSVLGTVCKVSVSWIYGTFSSQVAAITVPTLTSPTVQLLIQSLFTPTLTQRAGCGLTPTTCRSLYPPAKKLHTYRRVPGDSQPEPRSFEGAKWKPRSMRNTVWRTNSEHRFPAPFSKVCVEERPSFSSSSYLQW